jgi:Uma2 family endonuclease
MSAIVIAVEARGPDGQQARIPAWVKDLNSFRRWAKSESFPKHGWFSYLDGEIWVGTGMEQLITHNRVKTQYTVVIGGLVENEERGYFFTDRVLLTNEEANLSTEPGGSFASFESIETGKVELVPGSEEGFVELARAPDMALEIVSKFSVRKNTEILRDLYWKAGITEYWLVDVRKEPLRFDILRHSTRGYVASRKQDGWIKSTVFGKAFLLETEKDRLGNPQYFLRVK